MLILDVFYILIHKNEHLSQMKKVFFNAQKFKLCQRKYNYLCNVMIIHHLAKRKN